VLREELGHQVADILRSTGTTAILVTHDRHEAITLGDRVAVMGAGRIHQCAPPEEVYLHPSDRFVAGFVEVASFLPTGDDEVLLARPHQLSVESGGPDTVTRVEFLGATHRYGVRRADGTEVITDRGPDEPLAVGAPCTVRVVSEHLHRLD